MWYGALVLGLLFMRLSAACLVGGMEVGVEGIYLRPHSSDLGFVIVDDRDHDDPTTTQSTGVDLFLPSGSDQGVCPHWAAAFRVDVAYLFGSGSTDLCFSYTGLWTCDTARAHSEGTGGVWITDGHPRYDNLRLNGASVADNVPNAMADAADPTALAMKKVHIEHNRVDGVWALRSWLSSASWMRVFYGIAWADIVIRQAADYSGVVTFVGPDTNNQPVRIVANQMSHTYAKGATWGLGPVIGADLRWVLYRYLSLRLYSAASLLLGQRCCHLNQYVLRGSLVMGVAPGLNVDAAFDVSTPPCTALIPAIDARLGVVFCKRCLNWGSILIEGGWESTAYINGTGRLSFNDVAGTATEQCATFAFDGFYFAATVRI